MSDVLDQAIAAIREPDAAVGAEVQRRLDEKTKPRGSLGGLERLAVRIASIQRTAEPSLGTPVVVVCAADHGVAAEGVSAFPSSVTAQMVANYAAGGAAVSVAGASRRRDVSSSSIAASPSRCRCRACSTAVSAPARRACCTGRR